LTEALAGDAADKLPDRARLLWLLLDAAFSEDARPEASGDRAARRADVRTGEALAALRGVNVSVDGEPGGLCWLQLLHALHKAPDQLARLAARGPPRGCRPDCAGEARLFSALPPSLPRFAVGLTAAHASVRWAAGRAFGAAIAADPGGCAPDHAVGRALLASGAALAALDAGGEAFVYEAAAALAIRAPAAADACADSASFAIASLALAGAARGDHADFLAAARAADAAKGTAPALAGPASGLAAAAVLLEAPPGADDARGWREWPALAGAAGAALAGYAAEVM